MAYEDRRPAFNISGVLQAGISATDVTLTSTAFATLPTIYSSGLYLPMTIANDAAGLAEVVYVVGHASASQSVSVVRGREGTAARAFVAGDVVRCTPTPLDVQKVGGHAGQVGSFTTNSGSGVTLPIAGQDLYGGTTVASNALRVPVAGRYRITSRFYVSGGSGYFFIGTVRRNGAADTLFPTVRINKVDTNDYTDDMSVIRLLSANDTLSLWSNTSSGSTYGSTGYDGSYLEVELIQQT